MKDYGTGTTVFDLVYPDLVMGENTVLCPFHGEKTPSMQINTVQKIYHCFGCGRHGTENDFCMEYYNVSRDQVSQFKELLFTIAIYLVTYYFLIIERNTILIAKLIDL